MSVSTNQLMFSVRSLLGMFNEKTDDFILGYVFCLVDIYPDSKLAEFHNNESNKSDYIKLLLDFICDGDYL